MDESPLDVGMCFHREAPAAHVVDQARHAEEVGYDEFWVIEDCFFTAGVSLAAAALTATDRIGIGLGIMPVVARTAGMSAMEIATLAGLSPGRFHAGLGHGVQSWMAQMGVRPESPVTALTEVLTEVRALLAGERRTFHGRYVTLDDVALAAPPDPVPPVSAGVRGPRSLAVAGACADGTILADFVSAPYVSWARERIAAEPHRITVFASAAVAPDGDDARRAMSFLLAEVCQDAPASLRMAPFFDELEARAHRSSWLDAIQAMPADWWSMIAAVGTPDDAQRYLDSLEAAGVHAVAIFPNPEDPIGDARRLMDAVVSPRR
ncbi:MAG: LLM class flavin-dependent oxidoreductase [Actinomycetota bacterium]